MSNRLWQDFGTTQFTCLIAVNGSRKSIWLICSIASLVWRVFVERAFTIYASRPDSIGTPFAYNSYRHYSDVIIQLSELILAMFKMSMLMRKCRVFLRLIGYTIKHCVTWSINTTIIYYLYVISGYRLVGYRIQTNQEHPYSSIERSPGIWGRSSVPSRGDASWKILRISNTSHVTNTEMCRCTMHESPSVGNVSIKETPAVWTHRALRMTKIMPGPC